jgi:hypothetical protein
MAVETLASRQSFFSFVSDYSRILWTSWCWLLSFYLGNFSCSLPLTEFIQILNSCTASQIGEIIISFCFCHLIIGQDMRLLLDPFHQTRLKKCHHNGTSAIDFVTVMMRGSTKIEDPHHTWKTVFHLDHFHSCNCLPLC